MAELNKAAAAEEKALFLFDKGAACLRDGKYERAVEYLAASLALKHRVDTQTLYDMARERLAEQQQQQQQQQNQQQQQQQDTVDDEPEFEIPPEGSTGASSAASSWSAIGGRLFKEVLRRATSILQSSTTTTNDKNATSTPTPVNSTRAAGVCAGYTEEQLAHHVLSSKTYYQVLGLDRTSITEKDIKLAYRTMALKLHPDKSSRPESGDAFRVLSNAYETLSNDALRSQYDWRLDHPTSDDEDFISARAGGSGSVDPSAAVRAAGLARWFYAPRQPPTQWRQSRSCPLKALYWMWYIAAFIAIVVQLLLGSAIILAYGWLITLWRELFSLQYVSLTLNRTRVEFWISLSTKCFVSINGAVHELQPLALEKLILDMLELQHQQQQQQQQQHQQQHQQRHRQQQQHHPKKKNQQQQHQQQQHQQPQQPQHKKGNHAHAQPTNGPPRSSVQSEGKGRNKKRR